MVDTIEEDDSDDSDIEARIVKKHQVTRSGRSSYPFDYKCHFLGTAHITESGCDGKWIKPYYYDDKNMVEKLGTGIFYKDSYFADSITMKELSRSEVDIPIE